MLLIKITVVFEPQWRSTDYPVMLNTDLTDLSLVNDICHCGTLNKVPKLKRTIRPKIFSPSDNLHYPYNKFKILQVCFVPDF